MEATQSEKEIFKWVVLPQGTEDFDHDFIGGQGFTLHYLRE
jgi:hypothetical protein